MPTKQILVNGVEDQGVPGDDPGLLLGLTVFDTLRTYDGVPFRLLQHLERLERSAEALSLPYPGRVALDADLAQLDMSGDRMVRITLTAGGNRIVSCSDINQDRVGASVRVRTIAWSPSPWLPGIVKHGNRAVWELAAAHYQVDEVLLVGPGGQLLEANRSNIFAVIDGELVTPVSQGDFLEGVTRRAMLDAANLSGLPIRECQVPADGPFDELYLSSTLKELAPVIELDGKPLNGLGPVGERLWVAFRELVAAETEPGR
ncbi:MAG: aminotransferase class IV family protein [Myxococcales bacterium]|nr:aminotransferase class IV family protein [Myxococcales bacterium]